MTVPFRVAIPARYGSSRFPGKPLADLAGRSMIERVWRRAIDAHAAEVVIATDDERIAAHARDIGADVCLTRVDHPTGTDRLGEVAELRGWDDDDIVVNLQGDEPLTPPAIIAQVAGSLAAHPDAAIATLATPLQPEEPVDDPNIVKVVTDRAQRALYFSRAPIPWRRDADVPAHPVLRHLGLYAYRVAFLRAYSSLSPAPPEEMERLEQLRALWHGYRIQVAEAAELPGPGIDTPEDAARVGAWLLETGQAGEP